jgi:hypothetical protein
VDNVNLCSHSVAIKILSSFSYVVFSLIFAHMYFLPDICSSHKFSACMTALNKNDHLSL